MVSFKRALIFVVAAVAFAASAHAGKGPVITNKGTLIFPPFPPFQPVRVEIPVEKRRVSTFGKHTKQWLLYIPWI